MASSEAKPQQDAAQREAARREALEHRIHEEAQLRVKRARVIWERQAESEREQLEISFARQRQNLERDVATLQEELTEIRRHFWQTRFALDDATAQLAAREQIQLKRGQEEEEEDEEDATIADGTHWLLDLANKKEEAGDRFNYPKSIGSFPLELRNTMTERSFKQIIDAVKEARRAKRKLADPEGGAEEE